VSAGTLNYALKNFVEAKFYYPHALTDGNWCIEIREKMLRVLLSSVA